jgi:hypothetical protein
MESVSVFDMGCGHETQHHVVTYTLTYHCCPAPFLLQDFEALTPNLLARTVETVEGGGMIILLLSNLSSLTQLYSLTMDVHSRLRTESHQVGGGPPGWASGA